MAVEVLGANRSPAFCPFPITTDFLANPGALIIA
jgi:hypothetical protein